MPADPRSPLPPNEMTEKSSSSSSPIRDNQERSNASSRATAPENASLTELLGRLSDAVGSRDTITAAEVRRDILSNFVRKPHKPKPTRCHQCDDPCKEGAEYCPWHCISGD